MDALKNNQEESKTCGSSDRPKISNGKRAREVWIQADGHGDPNLKVYEQSRYKPEGHPTWKIYCGDGPQTINGILVEPPRYCYLDDKACHQIMNSPGYSPIERGRYWKSDFGCKGAVRPSRPNRGRTGFEADNVTYAFTKNPKGGAIYVFRGGPSDDVKTIGDATEAGLLSEKPIIQFIADTTTGPPPPKRKRSSDKKLKLQADTTYEEAASSNHSGPSLTTSNIPNIDPTLDQTSPSPAIKSKDFSGEYETTAHPAKRARIAVKEHTSP